MKALKATLVCLLVLGITALMFHAVVEREPLERERARRADNHRQYQIAKARVAADNTRRKASGKTGLESLIEDFYGSEMPAKREQVIRTKDEMKRMGSGAEWEAKKRELETLEVEINEYDQAMKKVREQVREDK